jgi:ferredoxin-NADP reductase
VSREEGKMSKGVFEAFDGYREVADALEMSRKLGVNYTADRDLADKYIRRLHPSRMRLRVTDVFEDTASTKTFRLVAEDPPLPPFQAGQYIALAVEVDGVRTSRPYSIASPPNQLGFYDITVRRVEDGVVSNYLLDRVRQGDVLESSGPVGEFVYNPIFHKKTMVCIAGGCGITPFMSMIREILECGVDRTVHLFYGNKGLDDVIFHETFLVLSERFENFHYYPVIEEPPDGYGGCRGLITGRLVKEILGDLDDKTYYLCGPRAMYDFCLPELQGLGIPRSRLRREVYGAPADITRDVGWPAGVKGGDTFTVKVKGKGGFRAKARDSLLAALEKHGYVLPALCRSGECSMCRVKLLAGKVFQPAGVLLRKSDRRFGYIHSCAAYPLEDLEISL